MGHDLLAELAGYKNELARELGLKRRDRAAAVRDEIRRVREQISDRITELEAEAEDHIEAGRDGKAGECAVAARPLQAAYDDSESLLDELEADTLQTPEEPTVPPAQTPEPTEPTPPAEPVEAEPIEPPAEPAPEVEQLADEPPAAENAADSRPRRRATTRGSKAGG
jgi:outer membrane biosynthesis protein TonB